ncbi:glycosyltransferase family 76 protein [Suillus subalutaceus]|uniref:glycosyltransferase family 76 protein n=1 Tax=Suillus subalutaceus TaxID=48586 RepID=UPI001B86ACD9|nr:glycosyltransferase family 76 protein [Suillus subalutaceus]KAG1865859.1 glycosyltransferase family 76 protein [Suillus subalutaceus]
MESATKRHVRTLLTLSVDSATCSLDISFNFCILASTVRFITIHLISGTSPSSVLLRWDAFHFAHIAREGYVYEHEWAFFNGLPLPLAGFGSNDWGTLLRGGAGMAILSPTALKLASYSEPFFTYFSYRGMLACARSNWATASIFFALASMFRSNGIFLSGFILWGMLVTPFLTGQKDLLTPRRLLKCALLTALPLIPFIHHNIIAYLRFCKSSTTRIPDWCTSNMIPSIYSHVQSEYWNVGFLRYWTVSNIPNFILALPALLHVFAFCWFYLSNLPSIIPHIAPRIRSKKNDDPSPPQLDSPFLSPLLPSLPLTYWAAARLMLDLPKWGKAWVTWSVLWGALSCVLWAVFLPPA